MVKETRHRAREDTVYTHRIMMERKQVGAQLGPITDDETEEVELDRRYKEQTDIKIKQE